ILSILAWSIFMEAKKGVWGFEMALDMCRVNGTIGGKFSMLGGFYALYRNGSVVLQSRKVNVGDLKISHHSSGTNMEKTMRSSTTQLEDVRELIHRIQSLLPIEEATCTYVENLKTIKIVVETDDLRKSSSLSLNLVRISCASLHVLELRKLRAT
nr:hypothetical protein [Tanacetum cinerariifolium]